MYGMPEYIELNGGLILTIRPDLYVAPADGFEGLQGNQTNSRPLCQAELPYEFLNYPPRIMPDGTNSHQ